MQRTIAQASINDTLGRLMFRLELAAMRAFDNVVFRLELARQRRHLSELDDRLLGDIGVTREEARIEAKKSLWEI